MPFRSHLGRSLDLRLRSNQALIAIVVLAAGVALIRWLDGEPLQVFMAPVLAFLVWALTREIDPDHQWTALLAGAGAAAWALLDLPAPPALALGGLLVTGRLVTSTTGRRPLVTDLIVVAAAGIAISFTVAGWVAGFGVALALYLDDRRAQESRGIQVAASALTAIGATVVATVARAFPDRLPSIVPYLVVTAGVIALALVAREPAKPISVVDARYAAPLDRARLHVSRATVGVLAFAMAIFMGEQAHGLWPLLGALFLTVVSDAVARRSPLAR